MQCSLSEITTNGLIAPELMMQGFQIREERRARIPAVTHVDGAGRLQTVHRETNLHDPRYHVPISAYHAITGVPMVLNTSFNENEPVCVGRRRRWIVF